MIQCVSCKKRNPLYFSLLLKYSINFILFLDDCNPLTLFVKKVKLLLLVMLYLLKTVSNTRHTEDNEIYFVVRYVTKVEML